MKRKVISLILIIFMLGGMVFVLTGCNNKTGTIDNNIEEIEIEEIEKISLYSGSDSLNDTYLLQNNELSVEMFRGGKKSEKKCTLTQEQIKNIEEIINKYKISVEEDKDVDSDKDGASRSYYSIKLKNDENVYINSTGIYELHKYFEELLEIE